MKVIITGASGFVGRNLLLKVPASWETFAIFNSSTDFEGFLKRHCASNIIPVKCDLRDGSEVKKLKATIGKKSDLVLYFASNTNPAYSVSFPSHDLISNVSTIINFFENFITRKVLYLSSLAVYEGHSGLVNVGLPLNPRLPYAISKCAAEQYIKFYSQKKGSFFNYAILRLFGAYGPYEPQRKIFTKLIETFLIKKDKGFEVRGDGKNYVDVMYIDDAIKGIMQVIKSETSNITVNFGTGDPLTINEVARRAGPVLGVKNPQIIHKGLVPEYTRFYMDARSMKEMVLFEPTISLEDGINKFADFLCANRDRGGISDAINKT